MSSIKYILIITILVISGLLVSTAVNAEAEAASVDETTTTDETATTDQVLTTDEAVGDRGGLPEQVFEIFVHDDCPHCKVVESFVDEYQLSGQVEFIQLKNNDANMTKLQDLWDELGVDSNNQGWPFMHYTDEDGQKNYSVGDTPIINVLRQYNSLPLIDVPTSEETATGDNNNGSSTTIGDGLFLVLGGVVLMAIVGYGVYTAMTRE